MDKLADEKNAMRKAALDERNQFSKVQVDELSGRIINKLMELEPVKNATTIMGFASIKNEVDLLPLLKKEQKRGKIMLLPRVEENGTMGAVEFRDCEKTSSGPFGIKEPLGEAFPVEKIDVILVPGLLFDGNGYRLGYGKGYYDSFLAQVKKDTFVCGVCYEFQVVADVFPHEADVPVHWIVTDKSELLINGDYF